ncbi:MAG: FHA domain-containing protein [Hyphomicrobiaceae bacterium]
MTSEKKPATPTTEILRKDAGKSASVDMDELVTTIRNRVAGVLVVTDGPGKGRSITFYEGSNSIGRDAARNVVALDFGDATIHRDPHAYLTCKGRACTLTSGGQANPVKINGRMLSGTEAVGPGDAIVLGQTTLRIDLA